MNVGDRVTYPDYPGLGVGDVVAVDTFVVRYRPDGSVGPVDAVMVMFAVPDHDGELMYPMIRATPDELEAAS